MCCPRHLAQSAWLREAHANVRAYWADPSELSQLMGTGEVIVAWSWNDSIALMRSEGFPVGFQRQAKEGASSWFCGYVNFKDAPGNEDKAYDFINAWLDKGSAQGLLDNFGYAHANDAAMQSIPAEALVAADVNPIDTTLLSQVPISPEMRDRMLQEFEQLMEEETRRRAEHEARRKQHEDDMAHEVRTIGHSATSHL